MATPQSKGGMARAVALSDDERREIARKAADARWGRMEVEPPDAPRAVADAEIKLGDVILGCAVLPDGTRVLSERGISRALGRTRSGSHWQKKREHGANLPLYLTSDNLKPFISNDLTTALSSPIWYRSTHGGSLVAGVPATCLPEICEVWVKADAAGKLHKPQLKIAAQARLLLRGLEKLGIIAIIDEATGYQEVRAKDELRQILAAYISPTLLPWDEKFPQNFFQEMFRVYGWKWPPSKEGYKGPVGPRYAGKLIKQIIYGNLPPGVAEELDKRNPADDKWQRKSRMGQILTEEYGHPHVEKLVAVFHMMFKISKNKAEFKRHYEKAFPKVGQQLNMLDELDETIPDESFSTDHHPHG